MQSCIETVTQCVRRTLRQDNLNRTDENNGKIHTYYKMIVNVSNMHLKIEHTRTQRTAERERKKEVKDSQQRKHLL